MLVVGEQGKKLFDWEGRIRSGWARLGIAIVLASLDTFSLYWPVREPPVVTSCNSQ